MLVWLVSQGFYTLLTHILIIPSVILKTMLNVREVFGDKRSEEGNIAQIECNLSTILLARNDGTVHRCHTTSTTTVERTYQQPVDIDTVVIPVRTGFDVIRHVFLDSTGIHSLVCLSNGDMYYLHGESTRPWKLTRLRGAAESAVLVGHRNDRTGNTNRHTTEGSTTVTTNTVSLLVGTSVGFLYEVLLTIEETISIAATRIVTIVVREQSAVVLHQLEDQTAITSLRLETLRCNNDTDGKKKVDDIRFLLLFATYAPARLYHFLWASIRTHPLPGGLPSAQVELPSLQTLKLHAEASNQSSSTNLSPLILSAKLYTRLALLSADILELPGESSWGTREHGLPPLLFLSPPISAAGSHEDAQPIAAGSRTSTRIAGTNSSSTVTDAKSVMPAAIFALLTPMGIYHGSLSLSMQNNGGADVTVSLDSAHLFPYALPSRSVASTTTAITSNSNSSSVGAGAGSGGSGGVSAESGGVGFDDDGDDDHDDAMDDALMRTTVASSTNSSLLMPNLAATTAEGAETTMTSALAVASSNNCIPVGLAVTTHHFLMLAEVNDSSNSNSNGNRLDHDPHPIMYLLLFMSRLDGHLVHCIHLVTEEGNTTPVINPQTTASTTTTGHTPTHPSSSIHRIVFDKDKQDHGRATSSVVQVRGRPLGLSALTSAAAAASTSSGIRNGVTTCCWLYTARSVLEVRVEDEESFVWRTYLNKALTVKTNRLRIGNAHGKLSRAINSDSDDAVREAADDVLSPAALANTLASFRSALQFCKHNSERSLVLRSEAEFLLSLAHLSPQGDGINSRSGCEQQQQQQHEQAAAVCFAQSNVAFDEAVLRLLRMIPAVTTVASVEQMRQEEQSDGDLGRDYEGGHSTLGDDVNFAKDWRWLGDVSLHEGQSTMTVWRWQAVHQYLNELVNDHDSSSAAAASAAVSDSSAGLSLIKRTMICTWYHIEYLHILVSCHVLRSSPSSSHLSCCRRICELALQRVTHLEQQLQLANKGSSNIAVSSSSSSQTVNGGGRGTDQQTVIMQALAGTVGEIKDFLRKQRSSLDTTTTAALLRTHCTSRSSSRSLPLFYSQIVGDFDNLTALYISEGNHRAAVAVLGDAAASPTVGLRRVEGLIYKHGPQLFEFAPEAFVSLLLRIGVGTSRLASQSGSNHKQYKTGLSLTGLLPAVLRYTTLLDRQSMQRRQTMPPVPGTVPSRSLDINAEGQRVNFAIFLLLELYKRSGVRSSTALPEDPLVLQTLMWLLIKYHGEGYDCEDYGNSHDMEVVLVRVLRPLCERLLSLKNECLENFLAADLETQATGWTGSLSHELVGSLDGDDPLADELVLLPSDSSRASVTPSALSLDRDFADIHAIATNDIVQTGTPQRHTFSVNRVASDTATNNDGGGSVYIRTAGLDRGDSITTPLPLLGYDAFVLYSARAHRAALARVLPDVDLDMLLRECLRKRESLQKSRDDAKMTTPKKLYLGICPLGKTIALLHVLCGRDEEAINVALDCDQQQTDGKGKTQTQSNTITSTHALGPSTPRSDTITQHHPIGALEYAKDVCRMLCGQTVKPSSASSTTTTTSQQHPSPPNLDATSPFDSTRIATTNFSSSLAPVLNMDRQRYRHGLWMIIAEHAMTHARVTSRLLSASPKRSDRQHAVRDAAQTALDLLADSDGDLQMEDLLPLMPDFTEFGLVRDELCRTLERSSLRVEEATASMAELADSAEAIVRELDETKNRGYTLSSIQRCELCEAPLFNTSHHFYVFPCSHGIHSECLLHLAPELLSSGRQDDYHAHSHHKGGGLEHVHAIVEQMRLLAPRAQHDNDKRAQTQMELLQAELDAYIAADCPLCGYAMIRSIGQPLISDSTADREEAKSWIL